MDAYDDHEDDDQLPEPDGTPLAGDELPGEALDPVAAAAPNAGAVSAAAPAPASSDDDFWGDARPVAPAPAPTGDSASGRQPTSWRKWLAAGVGVAAIAGGIGFGISTLTNNSSVANAVAGTNQQGPGVGPSGSNGQGPPGVFGTISAIDGSTITVRDQSGSTTTVVTTSSTTVTKSVTASVSDIAVGDRVMVDGGGSSSSITATSVHDNGAATNTSGGPTGGPGGNAGPPGGAGNGSFVSGTVTAVSGSSFTVTDASGNKVTVTTSSATTVTKDETTSVSSLAVGDTVMVQGATSNGTVTATEIHDGVMGGRFSRPPGGGSAG
jgi:hypothetical protein